MTDPPVQVALLGPIAYRRGGRLIPVMGSPQRVVLARLGLALGRVVPVAELIDSLWAQDPPENALGNLRSYVSRLRGALGADLVEREPAGPAATGYNDMFDQWLGLARPRPPSSRASTASVHDRRGSGRPGDQDPLRSWNRLSYGRQRWALAGNTARLDIYPEATHAFDEFGTTMAGLARATIADWIAAVSS